MKKFSFLFPLSSLDVKKVSVGDENFSMHSINLNTSVKVLEITNYFSLFTVFHKVGDSFETTKSK